MENKKNMPFQSEEGCVLEFFKNVQYDFWSLSSSTFFC
jgi:hypothetical protein